MSNLQNSAAPVSPSPSESSDSEPDSLSPAWQAGLLLAARHVAREGDLELPSAASILQATGAGRTRAYEMRGRVLDTLADRQRPPGRPPAGPAPPLEADTRAELSGHMLRYLRSHPGAFSAGPVRQHYADGLRSFVLDLRRRYASVPLPDFAQAIQIPTDTLTDWLRLPASEELEEPSAESPEDPPPPDPTLPRIETVLDAWKRWDGTFSDFCQHVRYHLRIPWGSALIGAILQEHGLRTPQRRRGRSPDEKALRQQFETFFPGAQWVGDGSSVTVHLDGQSFTFNLELMTDASSGAFAGFSVRDQEDGEALAQAFNGGVDTTGSPPLALLVDARPSNVAPEVDQALEAAGPTLLLSATPARPQNKAHTEGAFGLFAQQAPPLVFHAQTPRELAREIVILVFQIWARTLNHKPRFDRGGRSRVQLYREADPTPEQVEQARSALQQRLRKQERARETRRRRADPDVRHLLDEAFRRLGLDDPTGNLRDAIAAYPLDTVLEAISIFEGRHNANTPPPDVDARYLLGIARNLAHQHEDLEIAHALWNNRLRARDHILQHLDAQRQQLQTLAPDDPFALLTTFLDQALDSERYLDRSFWLQAAASTANAHPPSTTKALFHSAARHISATFRIPHSERLAAIRFLAAQLLPLHLLHDLA